MAAVPASSPPRVIGYVKAKATTPSLFLSIGPFTFGADEHPPDLEFGVEQKVATHDAIGGTRTKQTMGAFAHDVTFSGEFRGIDPATGLNVAGRIALLQNLEARGQEQRLRWQGEAFDVIIEDFHYKYLTNRVRAVYTITVGVIRPASGQFTLSSPLSVDTQVSQQVGQINSTTAAITNKDKSAAAAGVASAAGAATAAVGAMGPIAQATTQAINATVQQVNAAVAKASAYYAQISSVTTPITALVSNAAALLDALNLLGQNVANGQSTQTIVVQGGNLFTIAAREFGDASLATQLASANGLLGASLSITKATQLVIPPLRGGLHI